MEARNLFFASMHVKRLSSLISSGHVFEVNRSVIQSNKFIT